MKKRFLHILFLLLISSLSKSYAQCTVKNILVKVNSTSASGGSCVLNFDFIFTIENNGGNKYIYIHSWLQNQYPNHFGCPNMSGNLKAPLAADLTLSKINLGIHNDIHPAHPAPTLLTTYGPDPTVTLTPATELIRQVYPTGDSARFTIKGVQITLPMACSQAAFMTADFWSTQSQNGNVVHCVSCNNQFVIDPQVFGSVSCFTPRTYNLIIRSVSPTVISGNYKIYTDNPIEGNIIGTFGPEDTLVDEHNYQTVLGTFNQYLATNMDYEPYSYTKPAADRNLWALVQTAGYTNSVLGYLINSCSPLSSAIHSFEVAYTNHLVHLNWDINPEAGIIEFAIEKRLDKGDFNTVVTIPVPAEGNTLLKTKYQYTDMISNGSNTLYYRLKMLMQDGQTKYSDIRLIQLASNAEVVVYPNPARGNLFVSVPVVTGAVDIIMTDLSGKHVAQWNGVSQRTLDIDSFKPGIYIMRIKPQNGHKEVTRKIVVY
ncbi:MAG: T9SS type A sorting domain-containing protein [Bacteroidota bacterium]